MTKSVPVISESLPGIYNLLGKRAATQEVLGKHLALACTRVNAQYFPEKVH